MAPKESLERVAELLEALPGTAVSKRWCSDANAHLVLHLTSLDSLAMVAEAATFANVGVEVLFVGSGGPLNEPTDVKKLEYRIQLSSADDDSPTLLQVFGIFLARHLKGMGLVPAEQADDLQRRWNAAVM